MAKQLIYKKGLMLSVKSWENDLDFEQTHEFYVDTLEEGKAIKNMCLTLFKSENNGDNGIGNSSNSKEDRIEEHRQSCDYFKNRYTKEEFYDYVSDVTPEFMGYSEQGYEYRVCDSCNFYEIKEDVFLDKIEL